MDLNEHSTFEKFQPLYKINLHIQQQRMCEFVRGNNFPRVHRTNYKLYEFCCYLLI